MKVRLGTSVALFSLLLVTGPAGASVQNDQVQSQHIREADGTSGQNTNSGAGIKTGHIQDSAVTSDKIQDGTIGTTDLANGAVTNEKIAVGSITADKLATQVYTRAEVDAIVSGLSSQIAALQDLLQHFSRVGNDIYITGANLNIVNGAGSTDVPLGVGNLIIGYNELRNDGTDARDGSHNLIVGRYNNYSSFGGVVLGEGNTISGQFATVTGGGANTASGPHSTVIGGVSNQSTGTRSVVGGGENLTATGLDSTAIGGSRNTASGERSAVFGGDYNVASGPLSVGVGGVNNMATGAGSTITGGHQNQTLANSDYSVIGGGYQVTVGGWYDWAAGGLFQDQ